ncbi:MAG: chlorite dismutase family protein [Candidatus Xenobia bacterium]
MEKTVLDLREKGGIKNGERQATDRRLYMQFLAFGNCLEVQALKEALRGADFESVLYEDLGDPRGVGLMTWAEDPEFFVSALRHFLLKAPFVGLSPKPEFTMFGRTYAIGHEPNLEDWLLHKPRRSALAEQHRWLVVYPLRRSGLFSALEPEEQTKILAEHGRIGHSFGEAGLAQDLRLACFGIDKNDNDFVIGLLGRDLFPLSACVQAMRKTTQTSRYIEKMGPFFTGRAIWQSAYTPPKE